MPRIKIPDNRNRSNPEAPILDPANVALNGCIKWLPPLSKDNTVCGLPQRCYDHPVVILSNEATYDGIVEIFLVSVIRIP